MSLNGTIVELTAGRYAATLAASGATLCALTCDGRDLVWPFDPTAGVGKGWQGRTIAPWPNRVVAGRYSFDGESFEVPLNEPERGTALHGLASWMPWTVEATDHEAVFSLDLPGSFGYPFDVTLQATFRLDADRGLLAVVEAHNVGTMAAPVGLTVHPYLVAGPSVDDCAIELDATRVCLTNAACHPREVVDVEGAGMDLRRPTPLVGREIDHAFTGLPDAWAATLIGPAGGVRLTSDAPWAQLFTGDGMGRLAVAAEPMTCGPDAFNRDPAGVRLEPGERRVLRYAITAL